MSVVDYQSSERRPPRRGTTLAITVDTTARAYDLFGLDLGNDGPGPSNPIERPRFVLLTLQADGADVYLHFAPDGAVSLDNAVAVAAGGTAAFATAMSAVLKSGLTAQYRVNRTVDRFLHIKGSAAATLRLWATSAESA